MEIDVELRNVWYVESWLNRFGAWVAAGQGINWPESPNDRPDEESQIGFASKAYGIQTYCKAPK